MTGFFNPFAGGAGGGGGIDYNNLTNKPIINGVTVQGSLTAGDLLITAADVGALPSGTKYGADFALTIDSQTFVVTAQLKDQDGNNLGQAKTIDLPLETMVVGGRYDDTTQKVILTLKNGQTVEFSVADLVNGLQSEITLNNKLDADLIDDVNSKNKFVTSTEKSTWNNKQDTISDLATIRNGAAAGATALQQSNVSSTYSATGTAPINGAAVNAAIETLDVGSVGGSGKYISAISETNGKISATPMTFDTALLSSSTNENAPTSKTVYDDQQRQEAEIGAVANAGAKNLLKNIRTTTTHKGVTFTVNEDGSVTVSGTNDGTGASLFNINTQEILALDNGDYILSGCPAGGSETGYFVDVTRSPDASIKDIGNGNTFTVGGNYTINEFRIVISRNVTVDNLTFYPMIRRAEITDDTFVPYAKTNRELTVAEGENRAVIIQQVDNGAKNLVQNTAKSETISTVSFTVNSDGTVLVNGTASTAAWFMIAENLTLQPGTYVISGGQEENGTVNVRVVFSTSKIAENIIADSNGESTEFTITSATTANVYVRMSTGRTANNVIVYPMICTKAKWDISQSYVLYRPSYDNLIDEVSQLKNYIGYEKSWILGLQVDYQNKIFTRLGKAVDLNPDSDFNQFNIYNKRRRCNVSDDGTINAFYGESGYIEDGTNGQVMVYQPKFYYKVEPLKLEPIVDGEGYHIRKANYYISETPRNGFKLHPAFKDENGNELEYYLIGTYEASLYDVSESTYILDDAQVADFSADKICSISNAKPISGLTQNLTRSNCEKLATNRGTRWHNMTIQIASAEQLLFMIEYGKMNAQEAIGKGVTNKASGEGNESINTGSTSNLGNASGAASGTDGLASIAYRGVENLWGNIWSWIDGVNIWGDGTKKGGIPYITNKLPFVENTKTDYNSAGFTTSGTNGYISAMGYGNPDYDWVFFASETAGNSTLPVGDYQYYTANLNGYRVAHLGGTWYNGLNAGLFCWGLHYSSSGRSRSVGGRGVIIPDINATNYWTNIRKAS